MSRAGVMPCAGIEEKVSYNLQKQKREGIVMVKTVRVGIMQKSLASVQRSLQLRRLFRKDWLSGERNTVWKKKTSM